MKFRHQIYSTYKCSYKCLWMLKQLKNVFTTNAEYMHDVIQSKLVKCVRELYPSNWFVLHMFECDSGSRIFSALITRVSNFLLFWWITSIYRTRVNMSTAILPFVCLFFCQCGVWTMSFIFVLVIHVCEIIRECYEIHLVQNWQYNTSSIRSNHLLFSLNKTERKLSIFIAA